MAPEQSFTFWQRLQFAIIARLGSWITKSLMATCRITVVNPEMEEKYLKSGKQLLMATWHRSSICGVAYLGKYNPAIMASLSKDGEIVSRYERNLGCVPIRGSSSRGGMAAQRGMLRFMKDGGLVAANVADGPQGPRYVAKAGMISLAQLTGVPLAPAMWSAHPSWVLKKSWDLSIIPKPFAKCIVIYGKEIKVPRRLTPEQVEAYRLELEQELNRLKDEADRLTGHRDPVV